MSASPRRRAQGFTLIEVMVVLVVAAILAAVAVPAYQDQMRKARRAEARDMVSQIQVAQERWRSNNVSYASSITALGMTASSAHYGYALSGASATGYTITATATGAQAADSACASMAVQVGATTSYLRNGQADNGTCWAR